MSSPKTGQTRPPEYNEKGPGKRPRIEKDKGEEKSAATGSSEEKDVKKAKKFAKQNAKRLKKQREHFPEACSVEDVRWKDVVTLLGQDTVDKAVADGTEFQSPFAFHEVVELEVKAISSNGEGLAQSDTDEKQSWVVVVPFCLSGERVRCKIYKNDRMHSIADFLELLRPNNELRDESRIKCKYFAKCGGCQYQMLSYDTQLDFKRNVVVKAYKNYSSLHKSAIPTIQPTIGSPLQYGYRTKITPHFQQPPPKVDRAALEKLVSEGGKPDWLQIGFNVQGQNKVFDIEECPIATPVINEAIPSEFDGVVKSIHTYKRGATLLFRESLDTSVEPLPGDTRLPAAYCNAELKRARKLYNTYHLP